MIYSFLKNLLLLSLSGGFASLLLILLSFITKKVFSPKWNFFSYKVILFMFIIPFFKFIKIPVKNKTTSIINNFYFFDENTSINTTNNFVFYVFLLWLLVFLSCLFFKIFCYIKFNKTLSLHNHSIEDIYLINLIEECKKKLNIKRNIKVKLNDSVYTPMLIGILNPTIIFPKDISNIKNLKDIIFHELIHFKRKDLYIKYLCLFLKSFYWFNPFIHLLNKNLNIWCEVSCDEMVIKNLSSKEKIAYGNTLLSIAYQSRNLPLVLPLSSDGKLLKLRLDKITCNKKYTIKNISCSFILLILILLLPTFLVSANVTTNDNISIIPINSFESNTNFKNNDEEINTNKFIEKNNEQNNTHKSIEEENDSNFVYYCTVIYDSETGQPINCIYDPDYPN